MRIVFLGTAELAVPCLRAVREQVVGVVTQPDRPAGRQRHLMAPPVKVAARELNLPVVQPVNIREPEALEQIRRWRPDLLVVVAYGQLLPAELLAIPPRGCVNVHASLLPRWRGAAPIQYAIWHGDTVTGVTTMFLNERLDAGDIIFQRSEPIYPTDTAATLQHRLAPLGAALLVETVRAIGEGNAPRKAQDASQATYARKLTKEDGRVDWSKSAAEIERQIRAFDPWPGAYTFWGGLLVKLWRAEVLPVASGQPGQVLPGLVVAAGQGGLRLLELQPAGRHRMSAEAFLCGYRLEPGTVLG